MTNEKKVNFTRRIEKFFQNKKRNSLPWLSKVSIFTIEVLLTTSWIGFGALSLYNFICSTPQCNYEDNTLLLLFFICLCKTTELWTILYCKYLQQYKSKYEILKIHFKFVYVMPLIFSGILILSGYLPFGPQFLIYGIIGGCILGLISSHIKYFTIFFYGDCLDEYRFLVHLAKPVSLMLICWLLPLSISNYYGITNTIIIFGAAVANVIPLAMIIKATRKNKSTKTEDNQLMSNFTSMCSLQHATGDTRDCVETPTTSFMEQSEEGCENVETGTEQNLPDNVSFNDDGDIDETVKDVSIVQNIEVKVLKKDSYELSGPSCSKDHFELIYPYQEEEDLETSSRSLNEKKFYNTRCFETLDDDESPPPSSRSVIYDVHSVQIHNDPLGSPPVTLPSPGPMQKPPSSTSRVCFSPISPDELEKIETITQISSRTSEVGIVEKESETIFDNEFTLFCEKQFRLLRFSIKRIGFYPSTLSATVTNIVSITFLASFPCMLYERSLKDMDPVNKENAIFSSLIFIGAAWHLTVWLLYFVPKRIGFYIYILGLISTGSSLLVYFLTDQLEVSWHLFGIGYAIINYFEMYPHKHFISEDSDNVDAILFNFQFTASLLAIFSCIAMPITRTFILTLSPYSSIPFLCSAFILAAFSRKRPQVDGEEPLKKKTAKRRTRNYRNDDGHSGVFKFNSEFENIP